MIAILIKIIHFIVCIGLIVIVLLQADKGEGLAGAFGSGASNTVFGERGGVTPMHKLTTGMAVVFMITSLIISIWLPRFEGPSSLGKGTFQTSGSTKAPIEIPGELPSPAGGAAPAGGAPTGGK